MFQHFQHWNSNWHYFNRILTLKVGHVPTGKHIETPKNIKAANYSKLFYKWKFSPPQLLNCICSNNIFKHGMRKHARCLVNDDFNFILITLWCLFVIFETMFSRSQNSFIAYKTTVHWLLIRIWSNMKVSKWLFF